MSTSRLPVDGNRNLLAQGIELLERMDDALYASPRGTWAPVGVQYRHVLEHYQSFLQGLPSRRVDYDVRAREAHLERSRDAALDATRHVLAGLACLNPNEDPALQVQMDCGSGECGDWRASSVGRELQFLCSHTVHHFALIKLLLEGAGLELAPEFGVAPSTLAYHRAAHR